MLLKLLKKRSTELCNFIDIQAQNDDGNNALHLLFLNFHTKPEMCKAVAKALIKQGIQVNAKNKKKYMPLHLAIVNNQVQAI